MRLIDITHETQPKSLRVLFVSAEPKNSSATSTVAQIFVTAGSNCPSPSLPAYRLTIWALSALPTTPPHANLTKKAKPPFLFSLPTYLPRRLRPSLPDTTNPTLGPQHSP
jgi:hypothetical protein